MLTNQRKQAILEKLAEVQEGKPKKKIFGNNPALVRLMGRNLGFGAVKASKLTAQKVPGQEVLHSGGSATPNPNLVQPV